MHPTELLNRHHDNVRFFYKSRQQYANIYSQMAAVMGTSRHLVLEYYVQALALKSLSSVIGLIVKNN